MKIDKLRLDDAQRTAGLNNNKLAAAIGVAPSVVSAIRMRGTCSEITALRMCRALGISLKDLAVEGEIQV